MRTIRPAWRLVLPLAFCLIAASVPGVRADELAEPRSATRLLAAGDQLAKEKQYDEALLKYKEAYEVLVPQLRSLPFREPVTPRFMVRSELKEYMATELAREFPEPRMRLMDRSLKVLGLVPDTLDVRETLLNLYTEEVGGFYNPRTKEMFLIREDPVKRGFLTRWLMGPEFNTEEQRITLAHEMVHALADQHFDLQGLDDATRGNDDVSLAVSSLIEGEATLVMFGEILGNEISPMMLVDLEPQRIDTAFQFLNWVTPFLSGRTMRSSPAIFRESLVFPYHKGTVFVLHLTNSGGWAAVNAAFREPPLSTEQILHPEKYLGDEPDWPTEVELPKLQERLDSTWTALGGNTLGELQLQIMLRSIPGGKRAAAGWDGDRYEVFQQEDGRLAVGWFTTWDSPEDAREFAVAAAHYFGERNERTVAELPEAGDSDEVAESEDARGSEGTTGVDESTTSDEAAESEDAAESRQENAHSASGMRDRALAAFSDTSAERGIFRQMAEDRDDLPGVLVEWREYDVAVLSGFTPQEIDALQDLIWLSQKAPLRLKR
jgi:hypothetical protein